MNCILDEFSGRKTLENDEYIKVDTLLSEFKYDGNFIIIVIAKTAKCPSEF